MEQDRLTEEAWLREGLSAQLTAAQQWETEACQDAEEIHGMFEDLSARVKLDEEAAARIQKEQDELLQKDAEVSQRAVEVLAELEMERDLRRKAGERSVTLQQRVNQDAEVISRLCGEWDELCQTEQRLLSKHSTPYEEHDWAI